MIKKQNLEKRFLPVLVVLVVGFLAVGAVKKGDLRGDSETAVTLQYRMPADQILKYNISEEMNQNIEVQGQSIDVEANSKTAFSVKSKGQKGGNHQLGITIDSMSINIISLEGELSPDLSSVIGKSFDMTLSPLGKELELSGAESIQYEIPSEGKTSISSDFQAIFPNLAGRSVKIGDTWTSTDTVIEKTDSSEMQFDLESVHTLEGFETVDGMECAKITAEVTGTLAGTGEQQGMELVFEGEIKGTDTWYFAYKKGIFVKMISTAAAEGIIEVVGVQDMTIPMIQEVRAEIKLAK